MHGDVDTLGFESCLAGGPATFSRDVRGFVQGTPPHAVRGSGQWLWCSDGLRYLDLPMALGAIPLGYSAAAVCRAVRSAVHNGNLYTLSTALEREVAGRLCDLLHFEAVRFTKTGSDAVAAAVRLARAQYRFDRSKILVEKTAYHGQHIQWKTPARGVPLPELAQYVVFDWQHPELWPSLDWSHIAAVVVEYPIMDVDQKLVQLRQMALDKGAVFILDEVVTGLRWPGNSVNLQLNLKADLLCLGKALGNGFALGAVLGPRSLMHDFEPPDPVFISTTFGTEQVAFAAANQVLNRVPFWSELLDRGRALWATLPANPWIRIVGQPCRSVYTADQVEVLWLWQKALLGELVLARRPNFPSLAFGTTEARFLARASYKALETLRQWLAEKPAEAYFETHRPLVLFSAR